jgi:hypothetical protein
MVGRDEEFTLNVSRKTSRKDVKMNRWRWEDNIKVGHKVVMCTEFF